MQWSSVRSSASDWQSANGRQTSAWTVVKKVLPEKVLHKATEIDQREANKDAVPVYVAIVKGVRLCLHVGFHPQQHVLVSVI
jgi:hypothetical protein